MKKAKIFKNGQSQAIRLPKEFQFKGKEVYAKKFENGVLLLPIDNVWDVFTSSLSEFSNDFMETREQPKIDEREGI